MTFDDLATWLLDTHPRTYESYVRKNLIINMLNVASNKMSQNKIVSDDGATASQAILYFYQVYEANKAEADFAERNNLITAYRNLRYIHMGRMIGAGVISLTTPNVMYKGTAEEDLLPAEFSLSQNYPNPFNPSTVISFNLSVASDVKLEVFNLLGQNVATLFEGHVGAGTHNTTWDATSMSSGVYFYRLTANDLVDTKKMLLLK